ncbi:hypothetical protein N5K35_23785 [Pseudomonas sp. GD03651]|uniref:hypothetical protein n=1 Tax=Pseudomonas TaxID=286 RepID=UPI00034EFE06|nr:MULTISPECIES: hypothetical protein [Pseudomonas]AGN83266.1 hypothetical protein L483_26675 [Pseudomonas putida H8234]MDH2186712.1 hypothetical protein [Pseudomonas sp. GD03651]HDS1809859.1 hypothetical protein [Pseudomonas putida]HDS3806741.1 hypothetical protein [Pseudomonas putida]
MKGFKLDNQWLTRFRLDITSSSNRLYANGRQQVEVTVTLEPRKGETLSEESLNSLSLVLIDEDGEPRLLDHPDLFASKARDKRFVYHAAYGGAPSALTEKTANSIRRIFYVTSQRPGGTLTQIYALMLKDENTYAITNTSPFVSSVVIESITPPPPHDKVFHLEPGTPFKYKSNNADSHWDDEVEETVSYFGFADPKLIMVESTALVTPSNTPFYERHNHDHALISFQLTNDYSQASTVTALGVGEAFEAVSPDSGEAYVQRPNHMTLHHYYRRFYAKHYNSLNEAPSVWLLRDQHGNPYHVEFLVSNGGHALKYHVSENKLNLGP